MFLPHFDVLCDLLLNRRTATWNLLVLYDKETNFYSFFFRFQSLSQLIERRPLPTLANTKKAIWRNLLSIQNEEISLVAMHNKELWLVQKNHLTQTASRGMKTYSQSRIERLNPQILKEMLEKSSQFLTSERPCEPKSLDAWILKELKEYARKTCGCGQHWRPFDSSFEWK